MTTKYQTQYSLQNSNEIFMNLKRISKHDEIKNVEDLKNIEIFDENENNMKKKLIRNNRYKFHHNFQFLFLKTN